MLERKLDGLLSHHNALRRGFGAPEADRAALLAEIEAIAPQILEYAAPVWLELDEARRTGRRILFEGAQGSLLDVDHGTYPYVTSSNTMAGSADAGSGLGPGSLGYKIGSAHVRNPVTNEHTGSRLQLEK